MKNTIRVRKNRSTASPASQAKTPPQKTINQPSEPELLIPSKIILECKDALSLLQSVGSAAGALVMMNAEIIKESCNANAGWETFEVPAFGEGSQELARMTVCKFHSVVEELYDYLGLIMMQIEGCNEPIRPVSRVVYYDLLKGRAGEDAVFQLENLVRSLRHCIEIQSSALGSRGNAGAYDIGMLMKDRLDAAYNAIWAAKGKLESAYLAATVAHDQQAVRRMAA